MSTGGAELTYGELHLTERRAGVYLSAVTFFFGNAALGGTDKILTLAFKTNDREEAERYEKLSVSCGVTFREVSAKATGDTFGKLVGVAEATTALILASYYAKVESNWVCNLAYRKGEISALAFSEGSGYTAGFSVTRTENTDVSFATVENYLLVTYGKTLKFGYLARTHTRLKRQLDVKTNVHGIKSAIEFYRLYAERGADYLGVFYANIARFLYYLLTAFVKEYLNVLKAVLILAAVKNSCYVKDYRFLTRTARKAFIIIRHFCYQSFLPDYFRAEAYGGVCRHIPKRRTVCFVLIPKTAVSDFVSITEYADKRTFDKETKNNITY